MDDTTATFAIEIYSTLQPPKTMFPPVIDHRKLVCEKLVFKKPRVL